VLTKLSSISSFAQNKWTRQRLSAISTPMSQDPFGTRTRQDIERVFGSSVDLNEMEHLMKPLPI
jgi:hypothetical protein